MFSRTQQFLFLIAFTLVSACSGPPVGTSQKNLLRRAEVEQLGKAMEAEVERHYEVLQHKLINRYVNSIGQSIVARNPEMPTLAYRFRVLRTNDVNAFSLPGGLVYITLGLLSRLELEAHFAAALAHELAHQDAGHALILWQERISSALSPSPSGIERRDTFSAHYFGTKGLLAYGAAFEREADEVAMSLMYQAGFDPRAYVSLLEELQRLEASRAKLLEDLVRVHPPFSERILWAREYLKTLPPRRENRLNSSTFQEIKQRLRLADRMQTDANLESATNQAVKKKTKKNKTSKPAE